MTSAFYVAWDGEDFRWLGDPAGVARFGELLGVSSLVVWRLDTLRERTDRVLAHRADDLWSLIADDGRVLMTLEVGAPSSPEVLEVIDRLSGAGPVLMDRVPSASWTTGPGDSYLQWGFTHPFVGADNQWHAEFCPELIAEQLLEVHGDARAHYLHTIYLRILLSIEHRGLPVDQAERHIDSVLYELNPDLLTLLTSVQMRVLDRRD